MGIEFKSKAGRGHVITYVKKEIIPTNGICVWIKDMKSHTINGKRYPAVLLPEIGDVLGLSIDIAEDNGYEKYLIIHTINGKEYLDCNRKYPYMR